MLFADSYLANIRSPFGRQADIFGSKKIDLRNSNLAQPMAQPILFQ
jgi:hypothetical protein